MNNNRSLLFKFIPYAVLSVLTIIAYINSIHGEFVYDDVFNIYNNQYIRSLDNWKDLLFNRDARSGVPSLSRTNYRPIFNLLNAVDYHFWRINPSGYHVTNIALHLLTCILLYSLLKPV